MYIPLSTVELHVKIELMAMTKQRGTRAALRYIAYMRCLYILLALHILVFIAFLA